MAGHSHWASIKHKKGAVDAKRGKLYSNLAKNITVAARTGGGKPADNLRLRYAIEKARAESMPKDSIERAIKKGTGELEGGHLDELIYEGIGPGGVSFIIEILTDNRHRTAGELRSLIEKHGGTLSKSGSVAWKFDKKGVLELPVSALSEEELFEVALNAGAENMAVEGDHYQVTTLPEDLDKIREAIHQAVSARRPKAARKPWGQEEEEAPVFTRQEVAWIEKASVPLTGDKARAVLSLFNDLEEHEDVQNLWSDVDIPEEMVA
jgi:YebC/PmpR family DNA-binding regulatory protein